MKFLITVLFSLAAAGFADTLTGAAEIDSIATDTTVSDSTAADTAVTDSAITDTAVTGAVETDSTATDTAAADTSSADTAVADTAASDSIASDSTAADSAPAEAAKPGIRLPKQRFFVEIGASYRFFFIPENLGKRASEHYRAFKTGPTLSLGYAYKSQRCYGVGLNFTRFWTSDTLVDTEIINLYTGESVEKGDVTEYLRIDMIGPLFYYQREVKIKIRKFLLTANAVPCLVILSDEIYGSAENYLIDIYTYGAKLGATLDLATFKGMTAGINLSFILANLKKYNKYIDNHGLSKRNIKVKGLNRIDLNVVLSLVG